MKKWEREIWPEQCLRYIRIFLLCHAYITSRLFTLFVKVWSSEEHHLWSNPCPGFWVVHLSSLLCLSCLSSYASPDCCLFTSFVSYLLLFLCKPPILPWVTMNLALSILPFCIFFCFFRFYIIATVCVYVNVLERNRRKDSRKRSEGDREKRGRKLKEKEEGEAQGWEKEGETEGLER